MRVAISTTDRDPGYVHETLTSMFDNACDVPLDVRCFVSGADASYLSRWGDRITVCTTSAKEAKEMARHGKKRRIFHNAMRCLLDAAPSEALAYFQDDVEFCPDWTLKLARMREIAPGYLVKHMRQAPDRYVLALYAAYRFKAKPVSNYPTQKFYGSQGLFFPEGMVGEIATAMSRAFNQGRCPPDDIWLKEWCLSTDTPILCGVPNLVQHIGSGSTIDSRFHTSPTFQR
jgi:hypothetical protein